MPIQRVNPDNVYHLKGLSATVKVGNTVYISGQVSLDENHNTLGPGDPAAQLRQIYKNLDDLCRAHGGTLSNMIKTITYITDIDQYPAVCKAREEAYGDDPPANSTVIVAGLARPEWLVEIEGIARID
ncbi:MAG: RidA family protein [Dehalococcoidia bacterium]